MPFNLPERVPIVSSIQPNEEEELYRRIRNLNGSADARANVTIGGRLKELFAPAEDLPMYKDKPHFPSGRQKKTMSPRVAGLIFIAIAVFFLKAVVLRGVSLPGIPPTRAPFLWQSPEDQKTWESRREAVKEAFITSWDGYQKYAWGLDEYHPVSKKGKNLARHAGGVGWMIVDALDTAMLMNLTTQVKHARDWMKTSLTFATDVDINTFETTIRVLGGLLSAHYISNTFPHLAPQVDDDLHQPGEDLYLELATDLAERILGAFDTDSGVPTASVNLNTTQPITFYTDGGASSTAEVATLQLELKYLAYLTGEALYWQKAERVMQVIEANQRPGGLVPIHIYPQTGQFRANNIRLGSRGDSYYEYLIKQYLQSGSGESVYLSMWDEALEGIKKHLLVYSKHSSLVVLTERPNGLDKLIMPKMDHLTCFLPGTIALSVTGGRGVAQARAAIGSGWTSLQKENLRLAEELLQTCWATYKATKTGLAPEIAHFAIDEPPRMWIDNSRHRDTHPLKLELDLTDDADWRQDVIIHEQDFHNLQRPETVESLYYMWKITGKQIYREWGWEMFQSFMEHSKLTDEFGNVYAYTSLGNVDVVPAKKKRDNMEGFWMSETLKYFWLLFGGNDAEMTDVRGGQDGPLSLSKIVINTEAHLFPRFDMGRVWKTGWERSNPKFNGNAAQNDQIPISEDTKGTREAVDAHARAQLEKPIPPPGDPKGSLDGVGDDHLPERAYRQPTPIPPPAPLQSSSSSGADQALKDATKKLQGESADSIPRLQEAIQKGYARPQPVDKKPDGVSPPAGFAPSAGGVDYAGATPAVDPKGRQYGVSDEAERMRAKEERFKEQFAGAWKKKDEEKLEKRSDGDENRTDAQR